MSRDRCTCGTVGIRVTGEQVTVRCNQCDWRYTYKAIPKRFEAAVRELLMWFKSREAEANEE